ncbi:MAG: S-layer homology domain-containing protein [Armatimonadetes bacterium]|nr:S-layer homology domain-containing protein [Armatimonadota bacterium]
MKHLLLFAATATVATATAAGAQTPAFSDVPSNHWAASSVTALAKAGIVQGYGASPLAIGAPPVKAKPVAKKPAYDGNKPVTRYELAVTLFRFVNYMNSVAKQPKSNTGAMVLPKTEAATLAMLVKNGYLKADSPYVKNAAKGGAKPVTANELAVAMGDVLSKVQANRTPISKGSQLDIEMPGGSHTHE